MLGDHVSRRGDCSNHYFLRSASLLISSSSDNGIARIELVAQTALPRSIDITEHCKKKLSTNIAKIGFVTYLIRPFLLSREPLNRRAWLEEVRLTSLLYMLPWYLSTRSRAFCRVSLARPHGTSDISLHLRTALTSACYINNRNE